MHKEHLGHAAPYGDGLVFGEQVGDHLGCGDSGEAQVKKREVSKEEVHGRMKGGARYYCDHNESVSQHSSTVDQGECHKEENLKFPLF